MWICCQVGSQDFLSWFNIVQVSALFQSTHLEMLWICIKASHIYNLFQRIVFQSIWLAHGLIVKSSCCRRFGILSHCYDKFSKAEFAGLSLKIAEAAIAGSFLLMCNFKIVRREYFTSKSVWNFNEGRFVRSCKRLTQRTLRTSRCHRTVTLLPVSFARCRRGLLS